MTIRSGGGAIATNIISVMMVSTLFEAIHLLFSGKVDLSQYWLTGTVSMLATTSPASSDIVQGIIVALA